MFIASSRPALVAWGQVSKTKYPSHAKKKKKFKCTLDLLPKTLCNLFHYTHSTVFSTGGLREIQISSGVETADCFKGMGRKAGNAEPFQTSLSCLAYWRFSMSQFFSLSFSLIYFTRCHNRWKKWLHMNRSQIQSPLNTNLFLLMFLCISYVNVL